MGIKRFFKNKIKDYQFIKNRRKLTINLLNLDFFKNYVFNFPIEEKPEVSIIIHNVGDSKIVLNCLYNIEKYDSEISKEIIIVGNENDEFLKKIKGIQVIENPEKFKVVKILNAAICNAKGRFIYLLDSHSLVQEHYLLSLINIFRKKEKAGVVGSKSISSENTIIEAGNLLAKDVEIIKLGNSQSIETPHFNFVRKVDFCSRSVVFEKIGPTGKPNLLDESFSDVYFAVADFCMRLKSEYGLDTYYNPFSEVLYVGNRADPENIEYDKILFKKIQNEFSALNVNAIYKKPNFLFLEENMPKPDQDSGSRRFLEIIKILQKKNHKITLAVRHFDEVTDLAYVKFFRGIGVEVCMDYVTAKDKIVRVLDQVKEAVRSVDVIWLFRPIGFDYWYHDIKHLISGKKLVYDMVDLHYLRMERENKYIEVTNDRAKLINFFREKEYFGMNTVDAVVSISDEEKNAVSKNGVGIEKIFTVSNIHQAATPKPVEFSNRDGLLFIGGYNHLPNIDAVKFLHDSIMPLVWEKNKNIKVFILGPDFPEDLKQKYHSEKFQILGFQKSVDHWFENARVFVAPLRYGAGVKGKIGQALEFRLPVITTGIGAEGMNLEDRKTALISDEAPKNFADKIIELYDDKELWQVLHGNSLLPLSKFSIETQEKNIKKMLKYLGCED